MFDNEYICRAHSKTLLKCHMIFSTKFRYKCLNPIRSIVFDAFLIPESISDIKYLLWKLTKIIYTFFLSFNLKYSISQAVRRLKQTTTIYVYQKNIDIYEEMVLGKSKISMDTRIFLFYYRHRL